VAITLTERDDNSRIQARVGDTLEVRLPEIASAGYRWSPDDLDPSLFEVKEVGADYPDGAIGASGQAIFRITVRTAGNGALRLKYWRPWEGEEGVQRRFAVEVEAVEP
jgi:inhibitor of cysteine peptidase